MADKLHQQYVLMHKNVPVADLELDTASGSISAVGSAHEQAHVPIGIPVKKIDTPLMSCRHQRRCHFYAWDQVYSIWIII